MGEGFIPERVIESLLHTYIYFSDWYGTSDKLDKKFVSYFRNMSGPYNKLKVIEISILLQNVLLIYRMRPNWNDEFETSILISKHVSKNSYQ